MQKYVIGRLPTCTWQDMTEKLTCWFAFSTDQNRTHPDNRYKLPKLATTDPTVFTTQSQLEGVRFPTCIGLQLDTDMTKLQNNSLIWVDFNDYAASH